jgi:hypothetical protein
LGKNISEQSLLQGLAQGEINLEDPRNSPLYGGTFAAVLPKAPLKKLTSYRVVFKGEVAQANRNDVTHSEPSVRSPVTREWTFTTGDKVDF